MNVLDRLTARKILIRAVNWIGDAVMTAPAIVAVRESFPEAEITLLANPLVSQLFSPHASIDRVITFDRSSKHKGISGRLRLAYELRKESFDAVIILPNSFDSALVPWLAGIPVRLGRKSDGRSLLLTHGYVPDTVAEKCHEVQQYLTLMEHFGIHGEAFQPNLETTMVEDASVAVFLKEQGVLPDDFLLGINPGATFGSAKRWYPERFAEAATKIASRLNTRIIVFGGKDEIEIAAEIQADILDKCINVAGKTTIRQLMALLKRCNFLITNDSGPMHVAAALGVPLAAVFGPTDHSGTAPFTSRAVIIRKETDCAPCKLRECPIDHNCMTAVTADDVVDVVMHFLRDRNMATEKL